MRRRDFLRRGAQVGAGALAFPSVASALTAEDLEQRLRRVLGEVAPLRSFRLTRLDEATWEVGAGWEPFGELIAQIPVADENTITVLSFVLPEQLQDKGLALKLYRSWGGKVKAAFPRREYTFLDG